MCHPLLAGVKHDVFAQLWLEIYAMTSLLEGLLVDPRLLSAVSFDPGGAPLETCVLLWHPHEGLLQWFTGQVHTEIYGILCWHKDNSNILIFYPLAPLFKEKYMYKAWRVDGIPDCVGNIWFQASLQVKSEVSWIVKLLHLCCFALL